MKDPFVGTWKMNVGRSEFDANHNPRSATMVIELDAGGHYVLKAEGTKAGGEAVSERPQRFIPDGKEYAIPEFPGLKMVANRPGPHMLQCEARREDGSVVGGGTFTVSADEQSLTAENFGYDSQLRQFRQRTVWERA